MVDVDHGGTLTTISGLWAPWSPLTLISIPYRLAQGAIFWAKGSDAILCDTQGDHCFTLCDGLHRYTPGGMTPHLDQVSHRLRSWGDTPCSPDIALLGRSAGPRPKVIGLMVLLALLSCVLDSSTLQILSGLLTMAEVSSDDLTSVYLNQVRKKASPVSHEEHCRRGHYPHDPHCSVCRQARLTAKQARRRVADDDDDQDSVAGYVVGLDLIVPSYKDISNHEYALVGVEITTNYSFVVLLKNKESDTIRDAIKEIRRQLKTANNSDVTVDLVRLHSDDDASFQKHVKQYLLDEGIKQTDTGGYRPQSNSRTERRIRTLKEGVKALLTQCTGGLGIYNSLWGEALLHANHCYNRSADSSGNIPYTTLTNKPCT